MQKRKLLSLSLIAIGITLIINSQVAILGAVVGLQNVSQNISLIVGLAFVVAGIVLFFALAPRPPSRIIREDKFQKSIRKYKGTDRKKIETAIRNIGSGLGDEHYLPHEQLWSIDVSGGGRLYFERESGNEVNIKKYDAQHDGPKKKK